MGGCAKGMGMVGYTFFARLAWLNCRISKSRPFCLREGKFWLNSWTGSRGSQDQDQEEEEEEEEEEEVGQRSRKQAVKGIKVYHITLINVRINTYICACISLLWVVPFQHPPYRTGSKLPWDVYLSNLAPFLLVAPCKPRIHSLLCCRILVFTE